MKERIKPMLAKTFAGQDVSGWWMQEKLDGIRAIWDGAELWTREGHRIDAPAWWTAALPDGTALDGELWAGRGRFTTVLSVYRSPSERWREMVFAAFDAPVAGTFEERAAIVESTGVLFVAPKPCRDATHAEETMRQIVAAGGEGIMLRRPGSAYEHKRSKNLLKLKPGEGYAER